MTNSNHPHGFEGFGTMKKMMTAAALVSLSLVLPFVGTVHASAATLEEEHRTAQASLLTAWACQLLKTCDR